MDGHRNDNNVGVLLYKSERCLIFYIKLKITHGVWYVALYIPQSEDGIGYKICGIEVKTKPIKVRIIVHSV